MELLCLIFYKVFIHARKRISFNSLKFLYHQPFTNICNEIDFKDKLEKKLPEKYYNFKDLIQYDYYE